MRTLLLIALILISFLHTRAQSPHEVLLVVNALNADALAVAEHYQKLRHIPAAQVLRIDYPEKKDPITQSIFCASWKDFQKGILAPIQDRMTSAPPARPPVAIVLSPGFPTMIHNPRGIGVSVTAALQTGGWLPTGKQIKTGSFPSPWFAGPDRSGKHRRPSASIPFPSSTNAVAPVMMLGVLHEDMNRECMIQQLTESAKADFSFPREPILFITNNTVRSTCRAWQFQPAAERLRLLGMDARILGGSSPLPEKAWGMMSGIMNVPPAWGTRVRPGGYYDHLTSFAATFHFQSQTKVTFWLENGASASSGTVQEPFAIWTKFAHARLYEHLRMGCTMLEAITLSTASPMQSLPIGDPLACPWGSPLPFSLLQNNGPVTVHPTRTHVRYTVYQEGEFLSEQPPPWSLSPPKEGQDTLIQVYARSTERVTKRGYQELKLPGTSKTQIP